MRTCITCAWSCPQWTSLPSPGGLKTGRLWRDWAPGYDASGALRHVAAALPDRAHRRAAIGYYRALARPFPSSVDPSLASSSSSSLPRSTAGSWPSCADPTQFVAVGGGYESFVNDSALVTGGLMLTFVMAMVVAVLLDRRRVRQLLRDPSRVPANLRRRARIEELRRRHLEEER
jgi:hypothetical protein